jgi:formylglycine-generating enzyme required for sulfatase activity/tRNA A-37 threonylcarbamoyl transferase component Bud32
METMTEEIRLGKYQIIRELGRGGFGIVYEARDTVLKRQVALKVLHPALTVDPQFLKRFRQEAELAAQMDHPNIVPIYDFDQRDGRYLISMGLMGRGSLKEQLKKYGAMHPSQAKTILEQVASGLAYAHERNIIHRDLKTSNILIDDNGVARIADFGFAKAVSADSISMSVGGGMVGTPAYMAPELWHGKKATEQSDIYSLGCITYEMLNGKELFYGETPAEVMTKHLMAGSQMEADLPKAWRELIEKCLAREPGNRYATVKALLEDLKFGLFDAAKEHETEIVLGEDEGFSRDTLSVSLQSEEADLDDKRDGAEISVISERSDESSAYDDGVLADNIDNYLEQTRQDTSGWQEKDENETLTPGQIIELSPLKRLRMKRSWLIPLSLGVFIIVLAVVLLTLLWTSNKKQFITNADETPTLTYTLQLSNTNSPTNTPKSTNTPIPTNTLTPIATLGVGSTMMREKDGMEMVYVPEGTFTMGSKENDSDAWSDEKPERNIYLDAYWFDKYKVSNAQYKLCVDSGTCLKPNRLYSYNRSDYYNNPKYDNYPVIFVNWNQANAYCEWAGGRLPTEAEWEKAARGTDGRKYPWGNDYPTTELANYNKNVNDTSAVNSYPKGVSPYGAFNMAGNVWEWVNDWWSVQYDVGDTNNPIGPQSGTSRVLRGGSWNYDYSVVRSANRISRNPLVWDYNIGFRCAFSSEKVDNVNDLTVSQEVPINNEQVLDVGSTQVRDIDGMEMVYVPEGTFMMGSADSDSDESPVREVYLDAYWIDKYEVNNAQYALCVEANECKKPWWDARYINPDYANHPIINVDRYEASVYCEWVGGSLPTEAQWEKAARGPNGNKYPWGNESINCRLANYSDCVGDTTAVDTYPEGGSYYGAMDMAGNVWEWVNDWYGPYDPNETNNPTGPDSGIYSVLRGGSWGYNYRFIHSSFRIKYYYEFYRNIVKGFRCTFPQN